jgi:hypothetical protein
MTVRFRELKVMITGVSLMDNTSLDNPRTFVTGNRTANVIWISPSRSSYIRLDM